MQTCAVHRILGEVTDYPSLLAAMRARAVERQIAIGGDEVHAVAGLPERSIPKLLSVRTLRSLKSVRRVGMLSLGPLLGVLGIKLLVIEDEQALKQFGSRLKNRKANLVRTRRPISNEARQD
jgi:hypothetical protein